MNRLRRALSWLSLDDQPTAIAMAFLVLYYCFTWGPWQGKASGDGWFGFLYLKAIYYQHTLDMRSVAPEFFKFFGESGPWHHMPNRCPFGPVLLWMPFYLLVAIPESILIAAKIIHHTAQTGQAPVHVWVTGLSTLCAVLIGWRATLKLFLRHLPRDAARLGAMMTIFATPLLWYTAHQPFYQHGIAFGTIALYFEYWERTYGELDAKRFVICGALLGYASAVRAQEIVYVLPIAVELVVRMLRGPQRSRAILCAFIAGGAFLVAFSPQALVWFYYSGKVAPVQAEPIRWREPWPLVVLFSTRAGLFPWTPIAFLGTVGVAIGLLRRDPLGRFMRYFGAAFTLGFYVVACAWVVPGAYAFGARRLSDAMSLVGLGIAIVFARAATARGRRAVVGICIACVVLNLGLMELLRERKIASPGSQTRSLAAELERMHASEAIVGAAAKIGWPFTQPEELAWTIAHRTSAAVYETVFGDLLLERDGQWLTLLTRSVDLTRAGRFHVAEGLRWGKTGSGVVVGHVRILLHMFATEAASMQIVGKIGDGPIGAMWNGAPISLLRQGDSLGVSRLDVRAGYDELELDLPLGSTLDRVDFNPLKPIERPKFPRRALHHRRCGPLPQRDARRAAWYTNSR